MKNLSTYTPEEIEEFLEAYKLDQETNQTQSMKKLLSVYDKIPIFKDIDPFHLKALVYDLKFVKTKYKDFIIQEGDMSEKIFFLIDGECHVFHQHKLVGKLYAGMVFGESGVIFKTKRDASVVCASEKAILLAFKLDEEITPFSSQALAKLYKNLAFQINTKLENLNETLTKK